MYQGQVYKIYKCICMPYTHAYLHQKRGYIYPAQQLFWPKCHRGLTIMMLAHFALPVSALCARSSPSKSTVPRRWRVTSFPWERLSVASSSVPSWSSVSPIISSGNTYTRRNSSSEWHTGLERNLMSVTMPDTAYKIVKTLGSISIRHQSDLKVWDRCLLNTNMRIDL